jgi:hypothetical protein
MRTTETTDQLPVMDADGVVHESIAPSMDGIAFGHKRSAHPVTPYASLAGLAGTSQGMGTAVSAGAGIRINRWLSATTGIGYQWMNAQSQFLGGLATARDLSNAGSPLTEMDFSGSTTGGTVIPEGNLVNAVEASDLTPLVDRVNQWQWHVGLEGHLGPRWKLEAGYTLGWGTQVTTQYPIVDAMGAPLESLDSDGSSLNDYGLVKSRSSLLYGGLAYAPVRWLEIFGRYAHDLGHYLDLNSPQALAAGSAQGDDKLSTIQVGVRAMLRP